jgi:hypothetical protein
MHELKVLFLLLNVGYIVQSAVDLKFNFASPALAVANPHRSGKGPQITKVSAEVIISLLTTNKRIVLSEAHASNSSSGEKAAT